MPPNGLPREAHPKGVASPRRTAHRPSVLPGGRLAPACAPEGCRVHTRSVHLAGARGLNGGLAASRTRSQGSAGSSPVGTSPAFVAGLVP
jgi:hypothetical protein